MKQINVEDGEYIFKEGELILEMHFIVSGSINFVLPRFDNKLYYSVEKGDHFGHSDLFGYRKPDESL